MLFSATMPQMLVQFTRAGLRDPVMIRLDVDTKISENLRVRVYIPSSSTVSVLYQSSPDCHCETPVSFYISI